MDQSPPILPAVPTLEYETAQAPPKGPRPLWVWAIVGIYLLLLGALLTLPIWLSLTTTDDPDDRRNAAIVLGILVASLLAIAFSLIIVPVKLQRRRPITRKTLWILAIGSGLALGMLVMGGGLALAEVSRHADGLSERSIEYAAGAVWLLWTLLWTFVFAVIRADGSQPASIASKLHRFLIAGSVLELLVAVPSHVIVRRRNECCAGIETGIGICAGIAVMLVCFGPSVLLLYYCRIKQITRK